MADRRTLEIYDEKVSDYVKLTRRESIDPDLLRFMNVLPKGAKVLDLGCGPGTAAAIMAEHGFVPDPVDASPEMVRHVIRTHKLPARQATFDEISGEAIYDGVWANFSLLHAKREEMPGHLSALHMALKPGGYLHIGMKLGEGAYRDKLGRFYTYYSQDELESLLADAGFEVLERSFGDEPGLSGERAPWTTILAKAV